MKVNKCCANLEKELQNAEKIIGSLIELNYNLLKRKEELYAQLQEINHG